MTWLTWRLQRTELLLLGAIMTVLVGMLVLSRSDVMMRNTYYAPEDCPVPLTIAPGSESDGGCYPRPGRIFELVSGLLSWMDFLPLIGGLLLAIPIIIELENGTYRLAWTQSVTRTRWALVKVGILSLSGLGFAAVLSLTFTWWNAPRDQTVGTLGTEWYDLGGTLPIAYTAFAIGLMLAIGTMTRRLVPTILAASIVYTAVRVPFNTWVRPHLVAPLTEPVYGTDQGLSANARAEANAADMVPWVLSQQYLKPSGKVVSNEQFMELCGRTAGEGKDTFFGCLETHNLELTNTFHPASHYWPLQFAETAIYLAAELLLIGFATWYMLRRIE